MTAVSVPPGDVRTRQADQDDTRTRRGSAWRISVGLVVALIAVLALVPVVYLIWGTFRGADGGWDFGGFARAYVDAPNAGSMIVNSVEFSVGSTVLAFLLGTGLAFLHARTDIPFKGLLFTISILPLAMAPLLYATSWIFLASPTTGLFNEIINAATGTSPLNAYSMWGMIWVQGTHLSPLAFLFMTGAFASMDPSLEESAQVCGASRARTFWRVTRPLILPSAAAASLLIFVQSLESFEVPGVLGLREQKYVFTSQLYHLLNTFPTDYPAAGALSLGLLVIALVAFYGSTALTRRRRAATVSGKAFRPTVIALGAARPFWSALTLLYFAIVVLLPAVILVYSSFLPYYRPPSAAAFKTFTGGNYSALLTQPDIQQSIVNTLIVSAIAAVAVMVLTVIAGWFTARAPKRLASAVDVVSFVPIIVPGIVLGVALSFVFLRVPIPIYDTIWIILLAFVIKYIPFGMRYTNAALGQVSRELEESAEVSGASQFTALRRIVLPVIKNGVLAGLLLVFILSFREVSAAILLYSPNSQILSVIMWQQVQNGSLGSLSALGTLMTAVLGIVVFIGYRTNKNFGIQQ
jgi:iron(III) transport system permease protein